MLNGFHTMEQLRGFFKKFPEDFYIYWKSRELNVLNGTMAECPESGGAVAVLGC